MFLKSAGNIFYVFASEDGATLLEAIKLPSTLSLKVECFTTSNDPFISINLFTVFAFLIKYI